MSSPYLDRPLRSLAEVIAARKPKTHRITREHWRRMTRHGYTMTRDGQRYMLMLTNVGTMNIPVEVV